MHHGLPPAEPKAARVTALPWLGGIARVLDGAIASVFPGWGEKRLAARKAMAVSAFQAAQVDRLHRDLPVNYTADQAVLDSMDNLNARARQARRDDWAAVSIVEGFATDVVGTGITPRAAARDARGGEPLAAFNRQLDRAWRRWSRDPGRCDARRSLTLTQLMDLAVQEERTVGGALLTTEVGDGPRGPELRVQLYEIEQLASDLLEHPSNGNEIRAGVEIDAQGGPVAYWLYDEGTPADNIDATPTRIEAERVHHFKLPTRVRETLSPSKLSPVLRMMGELKNYDDYERTAKLIEACIGAQVVSSDKSASGGGQIGFSNVKSADDLTDSRGNAVNRLEAGAIYQPPAGKELKLLNPSRPGPQYDGYMDKQLTMIAAGAGRGFSAMTRRYQSSYTAERRGLLADRAVARKLREVLIWQVLSPIRSEWVMLEIMTGRATVPSGIDVADAGQLEELLECDWQPPAEEPIDEARDAASKKIRLDYHLDNRGNMLNREGRDWREQFDDEAEQRDYAAEREIGLPEFAAGGPSVDPSEPRPRGTQRSPDGTSGDTGDEADNDGESGGEARGGWRDSGLAERIVSAACAGGDDE